MSLPSNAYIPTFIKKTMKPQQIFTHEMTSQDLTLLKEHDPFLYYSIPAVRTATLLNRAVDVSCLTSRSGETSLTSSENQSHTVKRQSCLTFECHSSKLLEELCDVSSDDFEFSIDDEQEDEVYSFLTQCENTSTVRIDSIPTLTNKTNISQKMSQNFLSIDNIELLKKKEPTSHFSDQVMRSRPA